MKQYFINKNSDNLLIFFTGWGCDEYEFEHLESNSDVLILYNFFNLDLDFDFTKYKNIDDPIFNVSAQKEFYGKRLFILNNARHNPFFRINKYDLFFAYL